MTGDDIEILLDLWEEARDRGEPVSPEQLCRDRPELLEELASLVAELQAADAFLEDQTVSEAPGDVLTVAEHGTGGRYRDERFLAEGGLGRVFVARDAELPREVALKKLQERKAGSVQGRRRFVLEAEITAKLEHPGVVPVYGLGIDTEGQLYYAMRLIRGETMGCEIERFHSADVPGRDPGERQLALQGLLRAFLATCQTIAYAHSRGVIYRDLKPENLMLGPYGEALVVDWGLAKVLGAPENEDVKWLGQDRARDATISGTVKGSPAFMSPEQAEGRVDLIGPASDVYSLGATLYALLTRVKPFTGKTNSEVLSAVRQGRFSPPRRVKPGVPRPLEAICLKAMSLEISGRYQGAAELAADVERWLSGEPISAWREPWYDQFRRWARRHRVVVASATAAVVMGVAVLAVTNGMLRDLAKRLDASNTSLRAALDDAERNLYVRDIDLADRAWWDGQPMRAAALLEECPSDRRGWEWRYLARRNRLGLSSLTLAGPMEALGLAEGGRVVAIDAARASALARELNGTVRLTAVSSDGEKVVLVMAERSGQVVVADSAGRMPVIVLTPGVPGRVEGLASGPDGRSIVMVVVRGEGPPSTSKEKISFLTEFEARLVVRSLETGKVEIYGPFAASGMPGTPVVAVGGRCFCPVTFGDSTVLFASRPGSSQVEQAWSGRGGVVVSSDGFRFAGRGEGYEAIVREVASGQIVATLRGHAGAVRTLAFSPDSSRLATASDDRTVRVWDLASGHCSAVLRGQAKAVDWLAFSRDGSRLASASAVDVVVWDPSTTSEATVIRTVGRSHLNDIAAGYGELTAALAGHRLAWRDTGTGRPRLFGDEVADVDVLASPPSGAWTALGIGDGSIVLLDANGRTVRTLRGHRGPITGLSFDRDGSRLASASRDGDVRIWDILSGRELTQFEGGPVVAISPEGESVVVGNKAGVIVVDAATGARRLQLSGDGPEVRRLAFRPDGTRLAVVRPAGPGIQPMVGEDLTVYEIKTSRTRYAMGDQPSGMSDAVFSPDGLRLATADRAGAVVIREASSGRPLLTLHGLSSPILRIAFTTDGNRLLAAGGRVDPLGLRGKEAEEFAAWDARPLDWRLRTAERTVRAGRRETGSPGANPRPWGRRRPRSGC
jgi:eukaryotic-like serine/threonine-protein kinase